MSLPVLGWSTGSFVEDVHTSATKELQTFKRSTYTYLILSNVVKSSGPKIFCNLSLVTLVAAAKLPHHQSLLVAPPEEAPEFRPSNFRLFGTSGTW